MTKTSDIIAKFNILPDAAVVSTTVAVVLSGLSDRTLRRHPALPRRYISADRYGYSVGDIKRLLSGEAVPESARRVRSQPKVNASAGQGA